MRDPRPPGPAATLAPRRGWWKEGGPRRGEGGRLGPDPPSEAKRRAARDPGRGAARITGGARGGRGGGEARASESPTLEAKRRMAQALRTALALLARAPSVSSAAVGRVGKDPGPAGRQGKDGPGRDRRRPEPVTLAAEI